MDKEWEEGDDALELKNSFEAVQELERRKMADMPQFDEKNPKAYLEYGDVSSLGPSQPN